MIGRAGVLLWVQLDNHWLSWSRLSSHGRSGPSASMVGWEAVGNSVSDPPRYISPVNQYWSLSPRLNQRGNSTAHARLRLGGRVSEPMTSTNLMIVTAEFQVITRLNIEGAITEEATSQWTRASCFHAADNVLATLGMQRPLIEDASMHSVPRCMSSSTVPAISSHPLSRIDKTLSPSHKAYALPKIFLSFRRVSDEAREQHRLSGVQ